MNRFLREKYPWLLSGSGVALALAAGSLAAAKPKFLYPKGSDSRESPTQSDEIELNRSLQNLDEYEIAGKCPRKLLPPEISIHAANVEIPGIGSGQGFKANIGGSNNCRTGVAVYISATKNSKNEFTQNNRAFEAIGSNGSGYTSDQGVVLNIQLEQGTQERPSKSETVKVLEVSKKAGKFCVTLVAEYNDGSSPKSRRACR
ncbi:hypothetical protein HYW36_02665 [Candidatus Saccharibacteria bacterium]|nr:hypothetical protein [Candidatus Saccharibacteria bacterium]